MKAALTNSVILRNIFSHMSFEDLQECRLVNTTWNFEAGSYIREFRRYDAKVRAGNPCSDLEKLDQFVSEMSILPFNGLTFDFETASHSFNCKCVRNESNTYEALFKKLSLKFLSVKWKLYFGPVECPAIKFIIKLLCEKTAKLQAFELDFPPVGVQNYLVQDWIPWLPELKVFKAEEMSSWKYIGMKIVNGAPNLKKLTGDCDMKLLEILPEEKYGLMDIVSLFMTSVEEEGTFRKLAEARPALSFLIANAQAESDGQFNNSFFRVLEQLLTSSRKTLEKFHVNFVIFPFNRLTFPALLNLRKLIVRTGATAEHLVNMLRSINYQQLMPVLDEVKITTRSIDDGLEFHVNPWGDHEFQPGQHYSSTVTKLVLAIDTNFIPFPRLCPIFPNVKQFSLRPTTNPVISYGEMWESWPQLQSIQVLEVTDYAGWNSDAKFLGIYPEEIQILKELTDDSLQKINIVPIRPSVLTFKCEIKLDSLLL